MILSDKSNVKHIVKQLSSTNENTVVSALTTLYYLLDGENGALCAFFCFPIIHRYQETEYSESYTYLRGMRQCANS